jgi:2-C-methyl-D-erythritol 4-phosphate cytidylyltransferase
MNYGVIVAAGKSARMGTGADKAFVSLGTKPVLAYSLQAFEKCADIHGVMLVVRKDRVEAARGLAQMFGCFKVKRVVAGGATRQMSVAIGLSNLGEDVKIVSVHDGARPCVTPDLISETIRSAQRCGSGVAGVKITDTVKYVEKGLLVARTLDRDRLWAAQTPQTFRFDLLRKAYAEVKRRRATITDEASALELISEDVHLVPAPVSNIKITFPDDLVLAASLMRI